MAKYRITNITHALKDAPRGFCLDFDNKFFTPTHYIVVDVPAISEQLQDWINKRWVKLEDATIAPISRPEEVKVTPGTDLNEVSAKDDKDDPTLHDEDFNLDNAKEAALPVVEASPGHIPDINQIDEDPVNARVSMGMESEHMPAESHSPIPGDRVRNVDDTDMFTVRAPHVAQPGAVVKS